ncbi:hypothetical protein [Pseudorhodobacter aquimaris]|uniref:hypothetical protein n=1 Tax=Pseudorhodobacter aquimaris TaxID=687412 RepID=UPI00067A9D42|nr:hypothetical protein [Pseudorhodobacter aquimaris]
MTKLLCALCALFISSPSYADVRVQFIEGAPKDTFVIANEGGCNIGPSELVVDFTASNAGLIFDVTASGMGVEVFQPFDVTQGADLLVGLPTIADGDQTVALSFTGLDGAQKIAFTVDVDDTDGAREITVSDAEMTGTMVSLTAQGKRVTAIMGPNAEAVLTTVPCAS